VERVFFHNRSQTKLSQSFVNQHQRFLKFCLSPTEHTAPRNIFAALTLAERLLKLNRCAMQSLLGNGDD
jgi:hypothetical protein